MVSELSIVAMMISAIIAFVFPFSLGVILRKKHPYVGLAFVVGGLSFFVLQVLIRIPLLQSQFAVNLFRDLPLFLHLIILAFTAGLFETVGRVLSIKFLMKKNLDYNTGLAHGIGHGGIEAVVLVSLTYLNYIIYAFMINNGSFQSLFTQSQGVMDEQLLLVEDLLINTKPYIFLLAGLERVFAVIFHIGMSVVVMYGFCSKKRYYFLLVLLMHFLFDLGAVILSNYLSSIIWAEVFILFGAVGSLYLIKIFKGKFKLLKKIETLKEREVL